jgi:DNA-binding MarR family transcriptional regulator
MPESTELISQSAAQAARELRVVVGRLRRRFIEASDSAELTPSQTAILSRLNKGICTASELAAAERVRPQAIAATLGVLEERGLIERHPDPTDRRRQLISPSAAGREFHEVRRKAGTEWFARELQDRYSETERQVLLNALELLDRLGQQ